MFEVNSSKRIFHANDVDVLENNILGSFPYVVRKTTENGIKGYLKENEEFLNPDNTLSFAQDTFTVFYQKNRYFTGNKVKILVPKIAIFNDRIGGFFVVMFQNLLSNLSWGDGSNVEMIKSFTIQLPTKNGEIDFKFMDAYISELEEERISELTAYLTVSGLDNYELSSEEKEVIQNYKFLQFEDFEYKKIFNNIKQGRRLKKEDQIVGDIPFVMSGITNCGVVNYISNPVASFPKNSITIDIFGNTFYRNYKFGAGDDTGVYWSTENKYSKEEMLFFATSMSKSIKGKYSYGKKLRSSQSFDFNMKLPIKNNEIDFYIMKTLISAVKKLVIKDVVLYADHKINATKQVVSKN